VENTTIKIAIIDDNPYWHKEIIKIIEHIKSIDEFNKISIQLSSFFYGREYFEQTTEYEIIILDYEMPELTGIEIAQKIEAQNSTTKIIFLSGYDNILQPALKANSIPNVVDFIIKEDFAKQLIHRLMKVIKRLLDINFIKVEHFTFEDNFQYRQNEKNAMVSFIDTKKILLIQTQGKETTIYTLEEKCFVTKTTLKSWKEILPELDFGIANKSTLVNFKFIKIINSKEIILINNEDIVLARFYKEQFKNEYLKYREWEAKK